MSFFNSLTRNLIETSINKEDETNPSLQSIASVYNGLLASSISLNDKELEAKVTKRIRLINFLYLSYLETQNEFFYNKLVSFYSADLTALAQLENRVKVSFDFSYDETISWVKFKGMVSIVLSGKVHTSYFPRFAISESSTKFFKVYKEQFPDKMVSYRDMKKELALKSKVLSGELVKTVEKHGREKRKKEQKEKQEKKVAKTKEEAPNKIKALYDLYKQGNFKSWGELYKIGNVSDKTGKKYLKLAAIEYNDIELKKKLNIWIPPTD